MGLFQGILMFFRWDGFSATDPTDPARDKNRMHGALMSISLILVLCFFLVTLL